MLSELQLRQILPLLPAAKAQQYLPHLNEALAAFEINTLLRTAAFIAQTAHESAQYTRLLESLIYSKTAGLMATWPSRFPTEASALPYVRNEEKLANFVYAGRMGNGDGASGEGFRYRGRGIIQLTGKANYQAAGQALGLDLIGQPELAQSPEVAFQVAGLYWKSNKLNELADLPNFRQITQKINGGQTGAADRIKYYEAAQHVLGGGLLAAAPVSRSARSARATVVFTMSRDMPPLSRGWQDQPADAADAVAERKPVAEKVVSKKKKVVAKKAVAKKAVARKTTAKKGAAKKAGAKKLRAKKAPARKATKRKSTAKKKTAVKKVATKKSVAKKPAAKTGAAKKGTVKKSTAKRSTAKKSTAKKSTAKKSTAKKNTARKSTARKSTARKSTVKKTTARKTAAKKSPARKAVPRKSTTTRKRRAKAS